MVSKIFKELPMSELHEQLAHTQNPYAAHTLLAERLADAVIVEAFKRRLRQSKKQCRVLPVYLTQRVNIYQALKP